jgi:hypothetical protein
MAEVYAALDKVWFFDRSIKMSFVNEYISAEDIAKYGLDSIDKGFVVGGVRSRSWTVDHERNIYLRIVARGREDNFQCSTWTFFWRGELIVLGLENISTSGAPGGSREGHKKLRSIVVPDKFKGLEKEIIKDLIEALVAYKDGGVHSTASSYSLVLDIDWELA